MNRWIGEVSGLPSQSVTIEIFRTNVQGRAMAEMLIILLSNTFPESKINFDLEDCDRILRVAGFNLSPQKIIDLLHFNGFQCEILD